MLTQWRDNNAWSAIGGETRVRDPIMPKREHVRVRALGRADGTPSFAVDGEPVAPGRVIALDPDDARRLVAVGKAEAI